MEEEYFIIDKSGRKRKAKEVTCSNCGKKYLKETRFIKNNNYCNRNCESIFKRQGKYVICSYCGEKKYRTPSQIKKSKSGLFFCSKNCLNEGRKISFGLKEVQPEFYNKGDNYRIKAIRELENKCSVCGYSIIDILEVHHKDCNRDNNDISNLDILCPTHHKEYQLGIRKYL